MRSQQEVARVIEDDMNSRITQHTSVETSKVWGRLDNSGLNLNTINLLDIGVSSHGGHGHSASEADNEDSPGGSVKRGTQVAQEKLRSGITCRGIDLPVDAERDIVVRADNRNRIVHSLLGKHQIGCRDDFTERESALVRVPVEYCRQHQQWFVVED